MGDEGAKAIALCWWWFKYRTVMNYMGPFAWLKRNWERGMVDVTFIDRHVTFLQCSSMLFTGQLFLIIGGNCLMSPVETEIEKYKWGWRFECKMPFWRLVSIVRQTEVFLTLMPGLKISPEYNVFVFTYKGEGLERWTAFYIYVDTQADRTKELWGFALDG